MARKATHFEIVLFHFWRQAAFDEAELHGRGYATDGREIRLNGHLVAYWHHGAVRMYLESPRWHPFLLAQAIVKIRDACEERGVLVPANVRWCREHDDCKTSRALGRACAISRFGREAKPARVHPQDAMLRRIRRQEAKQARDTDSTTAEERATG